MWLREQRAAGAAWRKLAGSAAAETQRQADQKQRFAPSASAPALDKEMIWGAGRWGGGCWAPDRARPLPCYWQALWGIGRWSYFLWGHRRIRAR